MAVEQLFLDEIRRRVFGECFPRLLHCLEMIDEDHLWYRPNEQSNSLANLIIHLNGNLRQWLGTTFGGKIDDRERQTEFDLTEGYDRGQLAKLIRSLEEDMLEIFKGIKPEMLSKVYDVQVYRESGISILVHITEHFSYHVGQATYLAKMLTGEDAGYYEGEDLG